jgi:hypothetical protein
MNKKHIIGLLAGVGIALTLPAAILLGTATPQETTVLPSEPISAVEIPANAVLYSSSHWEVLPAGNETYGVLIQLNSGIYILCQHANPDAPTEPSLLTYTPEIGYKGYFGADKSPSCADVTAFELLTLLENSAA